MVLEIEKAIKTLEKGGVIIYPSDTIWALGCDATNQNAINKIYKIKNRNKSIPFICLMRDYKMIQKYASINKSIINILKKFKEPTTVVYDKAQNLKTYSDSIGIRIPKESFCNNLLKGCNLVYYGICLVQSSVYSTTLRQRKHASGFVQDFHT